MRWFSSGWVIGIKNWSANSYITYILCKEYGTWKGISRGKRPMLGSYVYASWSAKDISSLGAFQINATNETLAIKPHILLGACESLILWCNERDPCVYRIFEDFITEVKQDFVKLLHNILLKMWNVDLAEINANCNTRKIINTAIQLNLPRLPIGYCLIKENNI